MKKMYSAIDEKTYSEITDMLGSEEEKITVIIFVALLASLLAYSETASYLKEKKSR